MVQLSPFPTLDVTPPPERSDEVEERREEPMTAGSPEVDSPGGLSALQLSLEASTAYHGYETYIEDGLICLKHKVRNLEKKKVGWAEFKSWIGGGSHLDFVCVVCPQLKLEDYRRRLSRGEMLNKDQMVMPSKR